MAEIWSDFGFCGVVFKFPMVDAVVFLGFVVNLCGSSWVTDFGFYGCFCFSGFCGESLWVSMGFSRFSASASVWLGWIWVC